MVETFLRELAADRAVRDVAVLTVRELLENIADHSGGAVGFLLIGVQTTKSGHRVQIKTRNPATEAHYERARGAIAAPLENGSAVSGLGRIRHEQRLSLELEFDGHELEFRVQV